MSKNLQPLRGMKDILPNEQKIFSSICETARKLGLQYGFEEMSVPIVEASQVYQRTLGDSSDIVSKEMYQFEDRGGESITLRPEFTAGVVRAFITHNLQQNGKQKLFCCGPLFRYERPQKGRQRQFHQVNFEWFGANEATNDIEILALASRFLRALSVQAKLEINSLGDEETRSSYRAALVEYFSAHQHALSEDSKRRLLQNPLRILDSKDEGDRALIINAPKLENYYSESAKERFASICAGLSKLNIEYRINPTLVRGMDYYTHLIFEYVADNLGAQNTVLAGGRYDNLVENMGGQKTPAIGFAAGIERLISISQIQIKAPPIFAALSIGSDLEISLLQHVELWRNMGFCFEILTKGAIGKRLKKASDMGCIAAIMLGEEEQKNATITIKWLESGTSETLPWSSLANLLSAYRV
jgi:histidyl-tRNA synthetase